MNAAAGKTQAIELEESTSIVLDAIDVEYIQRCDLHDLECRLNLANASKAETKKPAKSNGKKWRLSWIRQLRPS